ncbi:hypothetical protein [Ferrimicrobium sp.]|uniref:hypothetical protein n=1 Tax=Ferrimicrobium sp. TaxID=2926050 RepID=UPI0026216256|nr:hypothetical protein [Ferrimicrobium sp.]
MPIDTDDQWLLERDLCLGLLNVVDHDSGPLSVTWEDAYHVSNDMETAAPAVLACLADPVGNE